MSINGVKTTPLSIIDTKGGNVLHAMKISDQGYTGFGEGYRRCPGEHLSLIFVEEMANHFKSIV